MFEVLNRQILARLEMRIYSLEMFVKCVLSQRRCRLIGCQIIAAGKVSADICVSDG